MDNLANKMKRDVIIGIAFFVLGAVFASAVYANILLFSGHFLQDYRLSHDLMHGTDSNNGGLSNSVTFSSPVERSVPIVAVRNIDGKGELGRLNVKIIPGNSNVLIDTNPFLETDIQYSANVAVAVAKLKTNNYGNHDYILSYDIDSEVIGGGSAGAATAVAVIAALEGKKIKDGVAITGTINPDGSIGRVGGIVEKAKAVAEGGYKLFLIPKGQSKIRYYEKVTAPDEIFGFMFMNSYYVPRTIDLREVAKKWGLEVIEVDDIDDAVKYMLE